MSSFFGHSLAAFTIYSLKKPGATSSWNRPLWLSWLVAIALAPDLDHFIPFLHQSRHQEIRITHSLIGVLFLPLITIIILLICGHRGRNLKNRSLQLICTGLSHIVLDLLVGVVGLHLFWPWSLKLFKLPFGIFPSAGKLSLTNYYLYENLFIEAGIVLPLFYLIYLAFQRPNTLINKKWQIICISIIGSIFMLWGASLSR